MAFSYKVLGQVNPAATTVTTLYTVPPGVSAIASTLSVANISASAAAKFRLAIRVNGAALNNSQYLAYDAPVAIGDAVFLTLGITLSAGDIVSVYASNTTVAFSLFGSELA